MSLIETVAQTVLKHLPDAPPHPLLDARRVIDRTVDRVDGAKKVTGGATFAAEVALDGPSTPPPSTAASRTAASPRSTPRPPSARRACC